MIPSIDLWQDIIDKAAADTDFLGSATELKVYLVVSNFVPSRNLDIDSLTLASFTGSAAKTAGEAPQDVFEDPVSGRTVIQIKEPLGGWNWICTADPVEPQTVYGYIVTDGAGTGLIGSALLDNTVQISTAGQGLSIPYIRLRFDDNVPF